MAEFAVVVDGIVENTIVSDPEILDSLGLPGITVEITNLTLKPTIGDTYDAEQGIFVSLVVEEPEA